MKLNGGSLNLLSSCFLGVISLHVHLNLMDFDD